MLKKNIERTREIEQKRRNHRKVENFQCTSFRMRKACDAGRENLQSAHFSSL